VNQAQFCLSCITGYSLVGTICRQNFYLAITLTLGPGATNSIFSSSSTANQQAFDTIKNLHRFGEHFYKSVIPSSFIRVLSEPWENTCQMNRVAAGSVAVNMNVGAGSNTNSDSAQASMSNAIASSNDEGYSVLSSSVSSVGGSGYYGGSSSIGLIIGLTIPLSILCTLYFNISNSNRCNNHKESI